MVCVLYFSLLPQVKLNMGEKKGNWIILEFVKRDPSDKNVTVKVTVVVAIHQETNVNQCLMSRTITQSGSLLHLSTVVRFTIKEGALSPAPLGNLRDDSPWEAGQQVSESCFEGSKALHSTGRNHSPDPSLPWTAHPFFLQKQPHGK